MNPELEEKYARLWHRTNNWEVPGGLEPFELKDIITRKSRELYTSGMWKLLNMMAEDGLISENVLRRTHEEEPGMESGQSRVTVKKR